MFISSKIRNKNQFRYLKYVGCTTNNSAANLNFGQYCLDQQYMHMLHCTPDYPLPRFYQRNQIYLCILAKLFAKISFVIESVSINHDPIGGHLEFWSSLIAQS